MKKTTLLFFLAAFAAHALAQTAGVGGVIVTKSTGAMGSNNAYTAAQFASANSLVTQSQIIAGYQPLDDGLTAFAAGSDFVQFTGPLTSIKIFTLPNVSATLLYSGGPLGTPSSGVATNLTGTASGLTAGNVTTNANLTGDVTSVGNATTITSNSVALGTDTTGNYVATIADAGSSRITVANSGAENAAVTLDITNDAVSFAKMQNIATNSLVGRDTASTGDPENILLDDTLEMDGSLNLQRAALTGDVTASAGGNATTLATVNGNVGSFGSATAAGTFTVNAKGLVTAAGSTTITPAVGSITGLGTNVGTALAVNVGSAGAFVTFNGALGTPSSGVATNLTGTASGLTAGNVTTNANLTGDVTSVGNATTITSNSVALGTDTTGNYVATIADAGSSRITVANSGAENAAVTLDITNDAVSFAKMQNIATNSLVGRDTASTGDPENILLDDTLEMDGSLNLQRAALTGDVTASAGGNATTLATVNGNVGSFGSATAAGTFTVNAKGLVTAAGSTTITPAVGSITGLGTNVGTALAVNVGSAGAFVTFNGALGTPSSGVATNLTGTASGLTAGNVTTNANLTGDVTSVGNATTITSNSVALGTDTTGNYVATIADAGSSRITVANSGAENAAVTLDITNDAVSFAKMQNIATNSLVGRDTASTGDPENILLDDTLEMDGSLNLQRAALTGDVTASAGGNATTIANSAVTNAKMANMANQTIKGNSSGGAAAPSDLTALPSGVITAAATSDSFLAVPALVVYVKNIALLTSGTPADIGTITLPSGLTRWVVSGAPSTGNTAGILVTETSSGTLAAGVITPRDATGGGGNVVTNSTVPANAAGGSTKMTANSSGLFFTSTTITLRQTANSAANGTVSMYLFIYPLP